MPRILPVILLLCSPALCRAAATPEDMVNEGKQLENDGKVQQAVKVYGAFLKEHSDHTQVPDVNYRLAKCYDTLGFPDETIKSLKKALSVDKSRFKQRTEAQYMLAKIFGSMKKYPEAIEVYEKMLAEGAGLYEDEALNTAGLYYALLSKYDEAAAKYNILRRRDDPKMAKSAGHKLASLWIKAEKADLAVAAVQEFANQYPTDEMVPELLLRVAGLFVKLKQSDKAVAICEQVKTKFKTSPEAAGAGYVIGTIYRDRKQYKEAVDAFEQTAKLASKRAKGLAAEALAQAGEVYFNELRKTDEAMTRYEEAAGLAREDDSERAVEILKCCYFRLGEHEFAKKNWNVALNWYVMLRNLGLPDVTVNILPRITRCQVELGISDDNKNTPVDQKMLEEVIKNQAGTLAAAEAEITLLNQKVTEAVRRRAAVAPLAAEFEKLLTKYPKEVLADQHLAAYITMRVAETYAEDQTADSAAQALAAYEKVLKIDPAADNPYRMATMENIAILARKVGNTKRAREMELKLFEIKKADLDAKKDDKAAEKKALEYMKTFLSHADTPELAQQSIASARKLIEERGPLSPLSREAKFYIGELYYMKKEFSQAAKEFKEYLKLYGPPQKADGELSAGPWKPAANDAEAQRVQEAAIRVAHSWYMQGHEQNMVQQYNWIVRNMPAGNRWLPEAQYWLAMEFAKGEKGKTPENKQKMAEALWKNVVHPSTDFDEPKFANNFYPWVKSEDPAIQPYVRSAVLKAGQAWSETNDHESAAGAFKSYLALFKERTAKKKGGKNDPSPELTEADEMYQMARYALGLEYLALKNYPKLIETYKPYISELRQDPYRVNSLRLLGFHAGQAQMWDVAMQAYATILDEYGTNRLDADKKPIPVPAAERLRHDVKGWNGVRMGPPKGLDLSEVRFALGYLYWKQEAFAKCAQSLLPFLTEGPLRASKHREQALFMAGRSYFRERDFARGAPCLMALVRDHPRFDAIEEVYVFAAQGCVETSNWTDLDLLTRNFLNSWPKSDRRSRIELLRARGLLGSGKTAEGMAALAALTRSDTYEDVRADAYYYLALATIESSPSETVKAYDQMTKSVSIFARDSSCLEAGKLAMKLKKWEDARNHLERVGRDFPKASPENVREAKNCLAEVLKQLAGKK